MFERLNGAPPFPPISFHPAAITEIKVTELLEKLLLNLTIDIIIG
jgi:hypothetical protein